MAPLDYALGAFTGHQALTLLIDHASYFERVLLGGEGDEKTEKELPGFYSRLRGFRGLFFLVTSPIRTRALPIEFDHYLEIQSPPEELQLKRWEEHLGKDKDMEERLVDLVGRHPLHLHDIDQIARHATINAFLDETEGAVTLNHVHEAIRRLRRQKNVPVLFGEHG